CRPGASVRRFYFPECSTHIHDLPSFPTRRSSDLIIVALMMLWGIVAVITGQTATHNQGKITYAVDDAYIHMAIAKNFARHGVWGDRKSTRLNSSHQIISYAVFCLK